MPEPFGNVLRRLRLAAALTQERLAERAGISATGIAALEAGRRRAPRLSTVSLLIEALGLEPAERAELLASVTPGRGPDDEPRLDPPRPIHRPAIEIDRRHRFVGRPDELARLHAAFAGHTRVVLVHGEAGVGKTRLVGEFAEAIANDGPATVLWGRCTAEQLGAYEAFVDPIRAAVGLCADAALAERGELVRIVPELGRPEHGTLVPTRADPGVEQRLLFGAVVEILGHIGPTVLVIDDVQWADGAALALLAHLVASPTLRELMIVGTVRSTDVSAQTSGLLAELRRRGSFERINLTGLAEDHLAELVELVAGRRPPPGLVDAVAEATEGNPLFVEELTEHMLNSGYTGADDVALIGVPDGVRDTLGRRLAGISRGAQQLLHCGAVLGRTFDAHSAGALGDLAPPAVLASTEDALLSGLVVEQSARTLSFSHALVHATVYESMSIARRVDLHRRAAMQLEAAAPSSTVEIGQLVRHWAAVVPSDPHAATSAARWAVRAGDAAVAAAAIDEAIEFYGRAAALWVGSTAEHVDTLIRLGVAMSSSGRRDEGDQCLRTALLLADGIGDATLYARAAIGLAATVRYGHSDPERIEILDGAVARLGADEWVHRPAALVTLKRQLGYDSSAAAYRKRQTAAELVRQAVNRPETSAESLIAIGSLRDSIPVDDPIELCRLSERIIAAATPSRDLPVLANAWYGMAWSALELSDIGRWHEAVARYTEIAEQLRLPYEVALAATMAATSAQMTGRYAEADVAASAARAHAGAVDDANAQAVQLANSVLCGIDGGQAGVMLELMLAVQGDYEHVPTFMAGLAVTAASAGDAARAGDLLDRQAAKGFDDVRRDAEWLPVIGFLSHACAIAGVTRHADALHQLLRESPARGVRIGPVAAWWGPVRHHLGALDRLLGRLDSAEEHLEAALRLEADMGARPFEARTQIELAAVLEMTDRAGVDERVHALRAAAGATARELGAPGLLAVVG